LNYIAWKLYVKHKLEFLVIPDIPACHSRVLLSGIQNQNSSWILLHRFSHRRVSAGSFN